MRASKTPEYAAWRNMRHRCLNPRHRKYPIYGGRGISICPEWDSFDVFLADMGSRPTPKHSLDRINNNGNYEPSNCRWATIAEQARNRRDNKYVVHDGQARTVSEWAAFAGLPQSTLHCRLARGVPLPEALTIKASPHQKRGALLQQIREGK